MRPRRASSEAAVAFALASGQVLAVGGFRADDCWTVANGRHQLSEERCCVQDAPPDCWEGIFTEEHCCTGWTAPERSPDLGALLAGAPEGIILGGGRKHDRQLKMRLRSPAGVPEHVLIYLAFDRVLTPSIDKSSGYEAAAWNEVYSQLIHTDDVFLDLGANFGQVSVPVALGLAKRGRVIAIEPFALSFRCLTANSVVNGLADRMTSLHAAVGPPSMRGLGAVSDHEQVDLWLETFRPTLAMATFTAERNTSAFRPRFITVDSLNLDRLDFIKADIEGSELSALQGAERSLARWKPILYLEYHATDEELLHWLVTHRYVCYLHRFLQTMVDQLAYIETNLLCAHLDRPASRNAVEEVVRRRGADAPPLALGFFFVSDHQSLVANDLGYGWRTV